jgi:hypothetical protein
MIYAPDRVGRSSNVRLLLTGCLVTLACALVVNVAGASAADLLVLNGDPPVTLSGSVQYGIVYLDGDLRLTGDTVISAASIYIGPDAYIDSCYVPGSGDGQCSAGRSLTLVSSGPLTVATGISLQSGATNGPGGSLHLSGSSVAVAGQITTSGATGFGSGSVSIASSGPIATQGILAPGAGVSISGSGPILVGGGIQTQGAHATTPGSPSTPMQAGGPITIAATHGDVDVEGAIGAQGQSAPSGGGSGGAGGTVTIRGTNVYGESISTVGGNSQAAGSGPGTSGPINVVATGGLALTGAILASGAAGPGGGGASGAAVSLKAGGTVAVGGVNTNGGQTSPGAPITIAGSSVLAGDLNASGGGGSAINRNGANAAAISVTAPQGATLGALLAAGGSSAGNQSTPAVPGAGAGIKVVSSAGSISAGRVESGGGSQGTGPGASGGPIDLNAADDLSIAGDVRTDGSGAGGSWPSPWSGGNAGSLVLSAATGTIEIGGNASTQGGNGSGNATNGQLGGSGGAGGQITLIAPTIGLLTSLSAAGGPGGGDGLEQGPGGPGAGITAYTNAQIFNSERLVSSDGGDGNPTGVAGHKVQNSSPTSLAMTASGALRFTSQSPGAARYLLETPDRTGAPKVVEKTASTTGLHPPTPVCETVKLTVVAVSPAVSWTSDPSSPISYTRQPSKTQTCAEPPKLKLRSKLAATVAAARRAHWVETLRFRSAGIGTVRVALTYRTVPARHAKAAGRRVTFISRHATLRAELTISRAGVYAVHLKLPAAVRAAASGSVMLTEISPNGAHRRTQTLKVELSP